MRVIGKVHEDFSRDVYWMHIKLPNDADLFACASWEYLCDYYGVNEISESVQEEWLNEVKNRWSEKRLPFDKDIHFEINANTVEGRKNGQEFLNEIAEKELR